MNTFKKNGGFTLVELIIVIAILAILSTGAIAGYSAYIEKANDAAVEAVLSDIYTAAVLANAETGPVTVTVVEDTENDDNIKITVTNVGSKFETLFEKSVSGTTDGTVIAATQSEPAKYVVSIKKPASWDNSTFAGTSVTLPEA